MLLSIIAAVSENNIIGRGGQLPWRLSSDLRRFKQLTLGHAIIMGKKTWESIGRPLPGRTSIVISRQADWRPADALVARNIEEALLAASRVHPGQEAFVIGGAAIYGLALSRADRLYLTRVHALVEGDVEFPHVDWEAWQLTEASYHQADEPNDFAFTFQVWQRLAKLKS